MQRNAGGTNSDSERFETTGHPDPRDGGCTHCGRETTAVPLTDFGLERGQLCPVHGIVDATSATEIAADGGQARPADCECIDARELPCFTCWNAGFETVNPEVSDR